LVIVYVSSSVQITFLCPYLLHFLQCDGHVTLTYKPYFIFNVQLPKKTLRNIGGYRTTLMSDNTACILLRGRILCYRAVADRSHWQFQAARIVEVGRSFSEQSNSRGAHPSLMPSSYMELNQIPKLRNEMFSQHIWVRLQQQKQRYFETLYFCY
jgi:hypothetical protein